MTDARWYALWLDTRSRSRSRLLESHSRGVDRQSRTGVIFVLVFLHSVLFLSLPRSNGWPHHGRTFSIYLYPLSFWLTVPQRVLSTTWCCLSRPCVVFLACVHLAFLALFLSPGNSLVFSRYDHVTVIGETRDTIHTQYINNGWRCWSIILFWMLKYVHCSFDVLVK